MNNSTINSKLAIDANGLNSLKLAAKENSPEAIKEVAKQFEAIFMNMMLKSMREATPQDNPFDNEQSRTFTSMLDQQLTSNLASKGLGLADILAKQLSKGVNVTNKNMEQAISDPEKPVDDTPESLLPQSMLAPAYNKAVNAYLSNQKDFTKADQTPNNMKPQATNLDQKININTLLNKDSTLNSNPSDKQTSTAPISSSAEFKDIMTPHAEEASRSSGIPSKLMLGQAALETGWGKREIKGKDGTNSFNLFGIKANSNWKGKVVEAVTTEYVNGVKQKHITKFRAYDNYAESFKDFASLMQNNPRYGNVLSNLHNATSYAQAMQNAGYATDPNYANKLASVIQKVSSA